MTSYKAALLVPLAMCLSAAAPAPVNSDPVGVAVKSAMVETGAKGIAIATIENGQVASVRAFGVRNDIGDPLTTDTVMYGASLTKTVFGYLVTQLAAENRLSLDLPIAKLMPKPKGGHNDTTANTLVCLQRKRRCVLILSNDVRSERAFPALVRAALGDTGVPYRWEYPGLPAY